MHWFDFLFPPRADEAILRDVSDDDFLAIMAPRLVPETRPGTVALFPFNDARVRSAIHEAKYHGSDHAFNLLSLALSDYLRDCDDVGRSTSYICIVPVPLGKERLKERGFNQVHEVLLRALRSLGEEGVVKIDSNLLVRTRETISQISLAREKREENMRGAFKATRRADPSCTYILIDDVITTGATLQSAIDTLRNAGAENIIPLALAH